MRNPWPGTVLILLACALSAGQPHLATAGEVTAELIPEVKTIQPGTPFWVAVKLSMGKGWHTYWRNSGDSGAPTRVNWDLPDGFSAGPIQWPTPTRHMLAGIPGFGYEGEAVLLVRITPPDDLATASPLELKARIVWIACETVCVRGTADLSASVNVGPAAINDSGAKQLLETARRRLPAVETDWGFDAFIADNTITVIATPPDVAADPIEHVEFYPSESDPGIHKASQEWSGENSRYRLTIQLAGDENADRKALRGLLVGSGRWDQGDESGAVQINLPLRPAAEIPTSASPVGPGPAAPVSTNVPIAIVFAFLGGLMLNIMPCVFPVLSLKVMGFVNQAAQENRRPVAHGMAFALGVLLSFWVLGAMLYALRAAGIELSWGFQLQSRVFVAAMAALFTVMGLSLFGVFEIGTSLTALGSRGGGSGATGSFLTGLLATVIATPCTAPIVMGPALSVAFTVPPASGMLIFTSLGAGMAFPYVALTGFPGLLRHIPKPGPWMETFKQVMGFLMIATVVFLLYVLGAHGINVVIRTLVGLFIIGIGCWVYGRWSGLTRTRRSRTIGTVVALLLVVAGTAHALSAPARNFEWVAFDRDQVEAWHAEGKPVFVNFTANWCLNCKANEKIAFSSKEVQRRFLHLGVIPVMADLSLPNEAIEKELARFGRRSVPFYLLYTRDPAANPLILPEVLTPGVMLHWLDKLE